MTDDDLDDNRPHPLVDDPDEVSRNYAARPGDDLRDDVDLAGWDERSVWGYDTGSGNFYAQLWRNPGDGDAPDVWLSGINPPLPWPGCIVASVVDCTGCDPVSVVRALGLAHPCPVLRRRVDIAAAAAAARGSDAYTAGKRAALAWVAGVATVTPGGLRPWQQRRAPSAEEVVAEQYVITGRAIPAARRRQPRVGRRRRRSVRLGARQRDLTHLRAVQEQHVAVLPLGAEPVEATRLAARS